MWCIFAVKAAASMLPLRWLICMSVDSRKIRERNWEPNAWKETLRGTSPDRLFIFLCMLLSWFLSKIRIECWLGYLLLVYKLLLCIWDGRVMPTSSEICSFLYDCCDFVFLRWGVGLGIGYHTPTRRNATKLLRLVISVVWFYRLLTWYNW